MSFVGKLCIRTSFNPPLITQPEAVQGQRPPAHIESISSTTNPFVKHCLKLRQSSKYRYSSASAIVVGLTPIREIFTFHGIKNKERDILDCLLLLDDAGIPTELVEAFDRLVNVSAGVMRKIAGVQSTESTKAAALLRIPTSFCDIHNNEGSSDFQRLFPTLNRLLVLDGIQDPGNLGTLLRTAMAFGWDGVFLLPGCCDPFNDKAIRASRGSCFQIPIVSGDWVHLESLKSRFKMKMLAGHPENSGYEKTSVSLSPEFKFVWEDKPLALVVGSEGHGLSEESKTVCELISIPMAGGYESLNVSVAGGIFLFMLQARKHRTC
ncbi:putative tRNA/rRNA methyltransferase [Nymphaea thermarum]|nr:putative tRNA/rRNA methyltransferase [Nymphaea thermarum]